MEDVEEVIIIVNYVLTEQRRQTAHQPIAHIEVITVKQGVIANMIHNLW